MAKVLVVGTSGPADPTKAVLPFLTARNLKELGHEPALFLAGDSVLLIRDEVVDAVVGVGPGPLRGHFDAVVKQAVPLYL